jgi:hypothetical protein
LTNLGVVGVVLSQIKENVYARIVSGFGMLDGEKKMATTIATNHTWCSKTSCSAHFSAPVRLPLRRKFH